MELVISIIIVPLWASSQELFNRILNQQGVSKYSHYLDNRSSNFEVIFNNSDKTVSYDGNMYLYTDCIFRFAPKRLNTKMLLNPFEKQLNLPSVAVKKSYFFSFEVEVIRVISEGSAKVRCIKHYAPESIRIIVIVSLACKPNSLVSKDILISHKYIFTFSDLIIRAGLFPNNEESSSLIYIVESGEIKISPVKNIAGLRFVSHPVHGLNVMHICIANSVEDWYFSGNINLGVNLNARLCASKLCPTKNRHAKVDSCRINGIESSMKFKLFRDSLGLSNRHNVKGELLEDGGVSEAVNLRKHTSVYWNLSKSQMKGSFCMRNSNICKFSKTMAANELTVHNDQHMTPVRWCHLGCSVLIFYNHSLEVTFWEKLHNLCENIFATVHACSNLLLGAKEQNSKVRHAFEFLSIWA